MYLTYLPEALALFGSSGVALLVAVASWRRRRTPGAVPLALMMVAVAELSTCTALEMLVPDLPTIILFSKLEYVGTVGVVPVWLLFALEFSHPERRPRRAVLAALGLIPALTLLLVFTNEWHHLIWTEVTADPSAGVLPYYGHGWWFWVHSAYAFVLAGVGFVVLVRLAIQLPGADARPVVVILLGMIFPIATVSLYLLGISPVPNLSFAPFGFAVSGLVTAWVIFRQGLFHQIPLARGLLFDRLGDGVLVIDPGGRIVDVNAAAERIFGSGLIGRAAVEALAAWPDLAHGPAGDEWRLDLQIGVDGGRREYEASLVGLEDDRQRPLGHMAILRNVTERRGMERALQQANEHLRKQIETVEALQAQLREQATRDPLTGLYNRRYLDETLDRELARAHRGGYPVALMVFDVDHFKQLNDRFGHAVGDDVLRALALLLQHTTRESDIVCRYGGEEFVLVLPNVAVDVACERAETWRRLFAGVKVPGGEVDVQATASAGVALYPTHGTTGGELFAVADRALYRAKSAGRNRVVCA